MEENTAERLAVDSNSCTLSAPATSEQPDAHLSSSASKSRGRRASLRRRVSSATLETINVEVPSSEGIEDDHNDTKEPEYKKRVADSTAIERLNSALFVGYHADYPQIPLFAKFRINNSYYLGTFRAAINTPELELAWQEYTKEHKKSIVDINKLDFCPTVSGFSAEVTRQMSSEEKVELLYGILEDKLPLDPSYVPEEKKKESSLDQNMIDKHIHVGHFKEYPDVPIYAYLQKKGEIQKLGFRFFVTGDPIPQNATYEYVVLFPQFQRKSAEESKAVLKELLLRKVGGAESSRTGLKVSFQEPFSETAQDAHTDQHKSIPIRPRKKIYDLDSPDESQDTQSESEISQSEKFDQKDDLKSESEDQQQFGDTLMAVFDKFRKKDATKIIALQRRVKEQEETIKGNEIQMHKDQTELEAASAREVIFKDTIKAKDEEITRLRKERATSEIKPGGTINIGNFQGTFDRLQAEIRVLRKENESLRRDRASADVAPPERANGSVSAGVRNINIGLDSGPLVIQGNEYTMISLGTNKGFYREKDARTFADKGIEYHLRKVIAKVSYDVSGELSGTICKGGMEYSVHIDPDNNKEKLLSKPELITKDGADFVSWELWAQQ